MPDDTRTVSVSRARDHLAELLELIRAGELRAVRLVRYGRCVGWLVPPDAHSPPPPPSS